jgi:hypothetical protein
LLLRIRSTHVSCVCPGASHDARGGRLAERRVVVEASRPGPSASGWPGKRRRRTLCGARPRIRISTRVRRRDTGFISMHGVRE